MTVSECARLLREQDDILLITHHRPDGDTLGSASALCRGLRSLGKRAWLYPNPQVTETYAPFVAPYLAGADAHPRYVVAVDVADEKMFAQGFTGRADMAIDHHPTNSGYAPNTLVMAEKASCGEIVLLVLRELCGGIDPEMASLLYIAVSTDTGCFVYGNTTADTHRAAAELMDAGAEYGKLNKLIFRTFSAARLQLEGMVYTTLRRYRDGQINIAVITLDMLRQAGTTEADCEDLASLPGKVAGNKVSVTVRELRPGYCKVSVRTGPEVDASAICAKFGGGGHKMAAGCELEAGPEETAEQMYKAICEIWP